MSETLQVGTMAPEFTLPDENGTPVSLADFRGKKHVVLFFYPKDMTPICTREACAFRDQYEEFTDAGAEVIGISSDPESMHQQFIAKHRLPFRLVSDRGGEVRRAYGVKNAFAIMPGRVTFLIDKEGVIRHIVRSQFNPFKHIDQMKQVLRQLGEEARA